MTPRWPRVGIGIGLSISVIATLVTLAAGIGGSARTAIVIVFAWLAVGADIAGGWLLVGTVFQRLRGRPLSIGADRAVLLVPLAVGGSLAITGGVLSTFEIDAGIVGLAIAGLALAVATMWSSRTPSTPLAIGLVIAAVALVEIPREVGWINMHFVRSSFGTTAVRESSSDCTQPHKFAMRSHLTGNVGGLVESDDEPAELIAELQGSANASWVACMMPLVKPMGFSTKIHFEIHGVCHGSGDLDIKDSGTLWGIISCHDARRGFARRLRESLDEAVARTIR